MERIEPLRIKYDDGREYTLEFNRKTAAYAEQNGFSRGSAADKLMTMLPELFYFAFRMHHPNVKREEAEKILFEDLGGLTTAQIERLVDLFNAPYTTLVKEDGESKNSKLTVNI